MVIIVTEDFWNAIYTTVSKYAKITMYRVEGIISSYP